MEPRFCRWLWHAVTVLCDGTVTCGLDDPFKLRNYGNVNTHSIAEILTNEAIKRRRHDLLSGTACDVCHLSTKIDHVNIAQLSPSYPYPYKLVVESSIKCNIRCNNSVCNVANDSTFHVRTDDFLNFETFKKIFDEIGPHLKELFFFNYGEPFINPRALDMLSYARSVNPAVRITSSTNGLLLARGNQAERIVEENLIDWLCFTIGGCDEESYGRYHKSSSFEKAIAGMRKVVEAKRKYGHDNPTVHWRYLLFNWNDSMEQIGKARRLAEEIGVDEFKIFMTGTPLEGRSLRRAPETPGFDEIREWIDYDAHFRVDTFVEAGLWQPEQHPGLGKLCWSGRQAKLMAASADGRINIKLARPRMTTVPPTDVEIRTLWGSVKARVGNDEWADNVIPVPNGMGDEIASLPIEIHTAQPFTPLRHGVGIDGRELGVMVSLESVIPRPNPYRSSGFRGVGPKLREGCE